MSDLGFAIRQLVTNRDSTVVSVPPFAFGIDHNKAIFGFATAVRQQL